MKTMPVLCCVFPSGETLWIEADEKNHEYVTEVISSWKALNPGYKETKCTLGVVQITMSVDKYEAIRAENNFIWPET
jgi:hypothetical protein